MLKDWLSKTSGWQFHKWLFGPEKFSGLSRNCSLERVRNGQSSKGQFHEKHAQNAQSLFLACWECFCWWLNCVQSNTKPLSQRRSSLRQQLTRSLVYSVMRAICKLKQSMVCICPKHHFLLALFNFFTFSKLNDSVFKPRIVYMRCVA